MNILKNIVGWLFLFVSALSFSQIPGGKPSSFPLILDMVHNNPGEKPWFTKYNDPEVLKQMGYNGKVFFLFESAQLAINWDETDPDILPEGSAERMWVKAKAAHLDSVYNKVKQSGLLVFCQSDLLLFPKRLVEKYGMAQTFGDPSNPQTQKYLRFLLQQMFKQFPQLDGLVVRIGETYLQDAPYHVGKILNKTDPEKTIIPLLQIFRDEVCVKLNKKLIFRTWLSFDTDSDKYMKVSNSIEPHPNLIIAVKHCENDFRRGNPFSKVLGIGRHQQLLEVQCAREYEGKGAYPNYIAHGVIDGFEEHTSLRKNGLPASINDIVKKNNILSGLWTWTRGGGWEGPYITNELWCDLNAWVMAQWANNPAEPEESIFNRYASQVLHLSDTDCVKFRKLSLLSADAVIRGIRSVSQNMNPWWTRDQYIGWPVLPDNTQAVDDILREKDESVAMWQQIVKLSKEISFPDKATGNYTVVSSKYGLCLYRIYRSVFNLAAVEKGTRGKAELTKWIDEYDKAWKDYEELKTSYPECSTLYSKEEVRRMKSESADKKVNKLRSLVSGWDEAAIQKQLAAYNPVWTAQSKSSPESMPLSGSKGNGANVWVQDGDVFLYLANNECYDENADLLKLGCVRLHLSPNPFEPGSDFKQELDLFHSQIIITGKTKSGMEGKVHLWFDVNQPALHIRAEASQPVEVKASFATWRDRADSVNLGNYNFRGKSYVLPDVIEQKKNFIVWYHQNKNNRLIVNQLIEKQKFGDYKNSIHDFSHDLIFGGMISGNGLVADGSEPVQWQRWSGNAWHLRSDKPAREFDVVVVPQVKQEPDLKKWKQQLNISFKKATEKVDESWAVTQKWWSDFWQRSYIFINPEGGQADQGWQVGKNYQLFRYMWACNRDGRLPLKFNGGIFTTDPPASESIKHFTAQYKVSDKVTPDYRRWGNLFMAQNQRLIGWSGLGSGDFDLMLPSLDFYAQRLPVAEARSKAYWNHGGAAFFEPLDLSGLPVNWLASPDGSMRPAHLKYHLSMQIEFAYMAIQWAKYSGGDIRTYLPFIESVVRFYDEHYRMENRNRTGKEYNDNGKLVLFPLNSLELFSEATDPVEVVTGLQRVTAEILSFPVGVIPAATKEWFASFQKHIPDINYEMRNGKRVIKPAREYGKVYNATDFPEMYTVWPYGLFHTQKKEGLEEAVNTWENLPENRRSALEFWSWMCTPIYAAVMGRTDDAKRLIVEKLSDKNANLKFTAFFGPGHDWIPDHNWGGSGMIGLQNMLLYSQSDSLYLFPAWPKEWNVSFKLYGLNQTTVECDYQNGKVNRLNVSPEAKERQVKILSVSSK
ncbi:MAG: DUF5703 domain-containing protein [Bacteroidota bacterium]|nr:DUF5703 domain-containing protein [Bacteroidota bacterium]